MKGKLIINHTCERVKMTNGAAELQQSSRWVCEHTLRYFQESRQTRFPGEPSDAGGTIHVEQVKLPRRFSDQPRFLTNVCFTRFVPVVLHQ